MKKLFSPQGLLAASFAVIIAVLVVFAVLPRIPDVVSAGGPGFSLSAILAGAFGEGDEGCCDSGDDDGDEGDDGDNGDGRERFVTPPPPTCDLSTGPSPIRRGEQGMLYWATTNATSGSINNGVGDMTPIASGSRAVFPNASTRYTATVSGPGGTATCSIGLDVIEPAPEAPTCTISAHPPRIRAGESSTLSWTTRNATNAIINHIGGVNLNESTGVSPVSTSTYILTATGPGGSVTCQTTIVVDIPETPGPTCTISAHPSTIRAGESSTLTWRTTNATNAIINHIGGVNLNESTGVSPVSTSTYILTATGPGGSTTCQTTIAVTTTPQAPEQHTLTVTKLGNGTGTVTTTGFNCPPANTTCSGQYAHNTQLVLTATASPDSRFTGWGGDCSASGAVTMSSDKHCTATFVRDVTPPVQHTLTVTKLGNGTGTVTTTGFNCPPANTTCSGQYAHGAFLTLNAVASPGSRFTGWGGDCSAVGTVTMNSDKICTATFVIEGQVPTCSLSANPSSIREGSSSTLSWTSQNATSGSINNGVGAMIPIASGAKSVAPTVTTTYTATVTNASGNSANCTATVTVTPRRPDAPSCTLSSSPSSINPGSSSTLSWTSQNATSGSINNGVGAMIPIASGSRTVSPNSSTTYTATVIGLDGVTTATCSAPVTVIQPEVLRCDSFSASPSSIDEGESTTLRWETTGATSVEIDHGVGSVSGDGSTTVRPNRDITYTLTARRGNDSVTCATSVDVDEDRGGGGGGSAAPRCELFRASDTRITAGERVTLRWETRHGSELRIKDNRGNEIFETRDDDDVEDGEVTVRPTRDTRYTLTVERGNRDDDCTVRVDVDDQEVTLITDRDQQPLTSVSLTQVPYTGFDAGPIATTVFYVLLALWAASVTYVLVIKKGSVFGFALRRSAATPAVLIPHADYGAGAAYPRIYPDASYAAATAVAGPAYAAPASVYGYVPSIVSDEPVEEAEENTYLMDRAHWHNLILSNDAARFLASKTHSKEEQSALLDQAAERAKALYPREDGWIVLNRERLAQLFDEETAEEEPAAQEMTATDGPVGSHSLADAIVTGNITAAYAALGDAPMSALADAAEALDALFRARRGEPAHVSDMLMRAGGRLSDEQIESAIAALASAIDGIYRDEASAVKLAIMKAIKATA